MHDFPPFPDQPSGILNRSAFDATGRAELRRATRYNRPTVLMVVEVDAFRTLFERFGQAGGDTALRELANLIRAQLREHDILARLGAASFAVLLPETVESTAATVAERLHRTVADLQLDLDGRILAFAVNIGITCCIDRADDLDGVLADADVALCAARRSGGIACEPRSATAGGAPRWIALSS